MAFISAPRCQIGSPHRPLSCAISPILSRGAAEDGDGEAIEEMRREWRIGGEKVWHRGSVRPPESGEEEGGREEAGAPDFPPAAPETTLWHPDSD